MSEPRTALITGVAGQDGVLLARHLLGEGYRVIGTRQPGVPVTLAPYLQGVTVVEQDLVDTAAFSALLDAHSPREVYNLAGFSSVGRSWDEPDLVHEVNAAAVDRMLDVMLAAPQPPRFFQASSSEVFGPEAANPQAEDTPHQPANPYAKSKSHAHQATTAARDAGLFTVVGILYNHESPLRGPGFVTRKISRAAVEIAAGDRDEIELGNLDVSRDWGAAREYVVAMHRAMTHAEPGDYVIATGTSHAIRELVEAAFAAAGVDDPWAHVRQDPALMRSSDARVSVGDPARANTVLGWRAEVSFEDLIAEMVEVDRRRLVSGVEESPDYLGT